MPENLRNDGANITEVLRDSNQTLGEVVSLIGQAVEDPPWDSHDPRGALIEGRLGRAIQVLVQSYLIQMREEIVLPQGRVNVSSDIELDFTVLELYRNSFAFARERYRYRGPLGSYAWLRNYQGILNQMMNLSGGM